MMATEINSFKRGFDSWKLNLWLLAMVTKGNEEATS